MTKTIFISYRRKGGSYIARSVAQYFEEKGYDVFLDVDDLGSGKFDTAIERHIQTRENFVLILEPDTLPRVIQAKDWLRREIEYAMDHDRNIVPLMFNDFNYGENEQYLTGKLSELSSINSFSVPHYLFKEALGVVCKRFLHPLDEPTDDQLLTQSSQIAISSAPAAPNLTPISDFVPANFSKVRPPLPDQIQDLFLPVHESTLQALAKWEKHTPALISTFAQPILVYKPLLTAQASVTFQDTKFSLSTVRAYTFQIESLDGIQKIAWETYKAPFVDIHTMTNTPSSDAVFASVSETVIKLSQQTEAQIELVDYIYQTSHITIPVNSILNLYGNPDKSFAEFQSTLYASARTQRDEAIDAITQDYEQRMDTLEAQLRLQAEDSDKLAGLEAQLEALIADFEKELSVVNNRWLAIANHIEEYQIHPARTDISITLFNIVWTPFWDVEINGKRQLIPIYTESV